MRSLIESFRFLTLIPLPHESEDGTGVIAGAVAWFPLVGAAIGGVFILADWLCRNAFGSRLIPAAVMIAVYAAITGGLHLDGLMDVSDAYLGWKSRNERLRIMKDPHVGAMGVIALLTVLLLQFTALCVLPRSVYPTTGNFRWAALLIFPVMGRWVMSYMCVRFKYARESGTGSVMVAGSKWRYLAVASFIAAAAVACAFVLICRIPLLIPVVFAFSLLIAEAAGRFFTGTLGGITGDTVGACAVISETLLLLLFASRLPELLVV